MGQHVASGDPGSDLFAGKPCVFVSRLLGSLAATRRLTASTFDGQIEPNASCTFLFPDVSRVIPSELLCTDPKSADGRHGAGDVLMLLQKRWVKRLVAMEFSTSRLSSCSPSSSRTFYGVFSPVADLLIGDSVENLEWIEQTSKMKYEARRFTMGGEISFCLSGELCCDDWLQMVSRCEAWQRVVGKMESGNGERFVYLPAPRPETDGDCAQKYHSAVARTSPCSLDKRDVAVAVRGLYLSVANPRIWDKVALTWTTRHWSFTLIAV